MSNSPLNCTNCHPIEGTVSTPLGNNAKSTPIWGNFQVYQHPILYVYFWTILKNLTAEQVRSKSGRKRRYNLLSVSRQYSPDKHRVKTCNCVPFVKGSNSILLEKMESGVARFNDLVTCGSVWACPVCSLKIQKNRKEEVLKALRVHRSNGGVALLATLTFSHTELDELSKIIPAFTLALSRMKASREYKDIRETLKQVGSVRDLEITHGKNGWHPHVHEVWFLKEGVSEGLVLECEEQLYHLWKKYCVKYGLGEPNRTHGVRLDYRKTYGMDDLNDPVGHYITKWADELTGNQMKLGKNGSRSPWGILKDLGDNYSKKDHALWVEYVKVMHGRRMLFWSRGLKETFKINELTDDEIAQEKEFKNQQVVDSISIPYFKFKILVRKNLIADVLTCMELGGRFAVFRFLDHIVSEPVF